MTHEHLNDEQLSAHLDGEPADGRAAAGVPETALEAEIDACPSCRDRLAALAAARAPRPPPGDPGPAIAPGRGGGGGRGRRPRTDQDGRSADRTVPPLGKRRGPGSTGLVVGAAAAAVLVAVVVARRRQPTPAPRRRRRPPSALSDRHSARSRAPAPTARHPGRQSASAVPDLGSINVSPGRPPLRDSMPTARHQRRQRPGQERARTPAGTSATSSASPAGRPAVGHHRAGRAPPACRRRPARRRSAATPTLVATATYDHVPALVVAVVAAGVVDVVDAASPSSARLVVVVARTGCRVLARTTL